MFRILSPILAGVGLLLAAIYPFAVQNFGGDELSRHQVFSKTTGFSTVNVALSEDEAPIRALIDYSSSTQINAVSASAALKMKLLVDGAKASEKTLEFVHSTPGENSVHSGSVVYRANGGVIYPIGSQRFQFAFSPVGDATLKPDEIELILMASAIEWDPRAQLVGYGLMIIGIVGFVMSTVLGKRGRQPNKATRWGRSDKTDV